uniref:Rad21/Rec8-like protein N-terminal domain-containing protein n=1 Tax=Leersia perrieri TaxID=77586 RepID=A0A0D9X619_9ORYZ
MFYSHTILARKSPLGTVWIAAHLERKIKKPQIDGIDIPSYAECIMFPEVPIALRLSGHLLLGLVRIYSWKVNYLFHDCNRMLSTIRTAFASVQVDLPVGADRAPFDSITLPNTFCLDDVNLDDAIRLIDTPDNHRKSLDQITLAGDYVTIDLDEDAGVELSTPGQSSQMGPEPNEEERLPPFHIDFGPSDNMDVEISVDPAQGNSEAANPSNINQQADNAPDLPEIMREAPFEGPELNLPDIDELNNDPMDTTVELSPFVSKNITPAAMEQTISPVQGLSGTSIPNVQGTTSSTYDDIEDVIPMDTGMPDLRIAPSPPQVHHNNEDAQPNVQDNDGDAEPNVQDNNGDAQPNVQKNGIKLKYDKEIVFSNAKRRKLPHTTVDVWKFSRIRQKDGFLHEPLVHGMCTNLRQTYERTFPHVSGEHTPGVENASIQDAPDHQPDEHLFNQQAPRNSDGQPEPEINPTSPVNTDAQLEPQLNSQSPRNADGQPEPEHNPKSPADAGTSHFEDTPEMPRFSPQNIPSPIRDDNSPFKTPGAGGTPKSGFGGTAATGASADMSYMSPGQDSYPQLSPFPFNDELDGDFPEIPSLISTPAVISTAGTAATGLGSMSDRTRRVAQYFKDHMSSATSDDQPGKFSLNRILEGRSRKLAARMFFETLVLKSYDYIDVEQEEAYGDIAISVKPSLSGAKP